MPSITIKDKKKTILNVLESIAVKSGTESLFRPVNLKINDKKIEVEEVNRLNTTLIRAVWEPASLIVDGMTNVVIDPIILHGVVSSRPDGEVEIVLAPPTGTVSTPNGGKTSFRLEGMECNPPGPPANFVKFTHEMEISADALGEIFDRGAKAFSSSSVPRIVFEASSEKIVVKIGVVEEDNAAIEESLPGTVKVLDGSASSTSQFGGDLLKKLVDATSGNLKMKLGNGFPIGLETTSEHFSVQYFLAPQADN